MIWEAIPAEDVKRISRSFNSYISADKLAPFVSKEWTVSQNILRKNDENTQSKHLLTAIALKELFLLGGQALEDLSKHTVKSDVINSATTPPTSHDTLYPQVISTAQKILNLRRGTFGPIRTQIEKLLEESLIPIKWQMEQSTTKRIEISDYIISRGIKDFPWEYVRPKEVGLAILYNFSPFSDTGAVVASKRLRERGQTVDIVSCSFRNRKRVDTTIERISSPYIRHAEFLELVPSWASWEPFRLFAEKALVHIERQETAGEKFSFLYTRAMWAPSHFAGVKYKQSHRSVPWLAEFSDPLSLDVQGLPRGGKIPIDDFLKPIIEEIEENFGVIPEDKLTIFSLAEIVVYAFADEIMFTNEHQKTTMLEHVYSPLLLERVKKHAIVSNHPTLPEMFYDLEHVDYEVDRSKINLAYFGEFYATRGITDVTSALRSLPKELRDVFNLHVFTTYIPSGRKGKRPHGMNKKAYNDLVQRALDGVGASGIEHLVHLNSALPYLQFLSVTHKFDYLIVNDATSGDHHSVNPYLPSKWSDYAGSSANSWAFVEEGSSLSKKPATIHSPVGNVNAARKILWDLAISKLNSLEKSTVITND